MKTEISIRDYQPEDVQTLANIFYHTIHRINTQHYTEEQVDVWAPATSLETEGWAKKIPKTKPIIATVGDEIVGFAEFEPNGHIDCFYCHHEWIGKGVGSESFKGQKTAISTSFLLKLASPQSRFLKNGDLKS